MHRTDIKAVFANLLNQLLLEEGGTFPLFRKNIIPIGLENREITAPTRKNWLLSGQNKTSVESNWRLL